MNPQFNYQALNYSINTKLNEETYEMELVVRPIKRARNKQEYVQKLLNKLTEHLVKKVGFKKKRGSLEKKKMIITTVDNSDEHEIRLHISQNSAAKDRTKVREVLNVYKKLKKFMEIEGYSFKFFEDFIVNQIESKYLVEAS